MPAPPRRPTPRDILGVPALPSGRVAGASARLRSRIDRAQASMAPPPLRILEGLFGLLDHRVLVVLCEAGVPEALTRPTTPSALAQRLGADADRLERLLRFAATRGWVRFDRRGRVRPTRTLAFLRQDHPGGWRAWVDFAGGVEVTAAVRHLSVEAGAPSPFTAANGSPFFEWMRSHPDRWATFDRAMAAGGRMHALGLHAELDWSTIDRVCDVGGGTGDLLAALLELEPHLEGTVYDLPDVVARAVSHPRLTAVGGDAFASIPPGFDAYLLVNVLHDWGDADATRLLARVAEAAPVGARIFIVDADRPVEPRDRTAASADVLMAALTDGGRERDVHAFGRLAAAAQLRLHHTTPLPSGDLVHHLEPR